MVSDSDVITLCVGGSVFQTTPGTLKKYPNTRLADLDTSSPSYDRRNKCHFFDRDEGAFKSIFNLYLTSELHVPRHICEQAYYRELEFWRVSQSDVTHCCWKNVCKVLKDKELQKVLDEANDVIINASKSGRRTLCERMCEFLEDPSSSKLARIFNLFMVLVLVISALAGSLDSLPQLRGAVYIDPDDPALDEAHQQVLRDLQNTITNSSNDKLRMWLGSVQNRGLYVIHLVCLVIFALELIARWSVCPFKALFFKKFVNWIDVITVGSGGSLYLYDYVFNSGWIHKTEIALYPFFFLQSMYIIRLLRFVRLLDRFFGLNIIVLSVRQSLKELFLLFLTYNILAMLFGCLEYYCDFDNEHMANIPLAMWWAVVTMMTLGYGDYVPTNECGRFIGTICSFSGLIMIALPLAVVSYKFKLLYTKNVVDQYYKNKLLTVH